MTYEALGSFIIIAVPLIAGLALLLACALAMLRDPTFSKSNVAMLTVGTVLCIAPTLTSINFKGAGIEISAAVQAQVGEQGAQIKRDLVDLRQRVDLLTKNAPITDASGAEDASEQKNKDTVVLVFYRQSKKSLAMSMERYLLNRGYSANAVYTDFAEIGSADKGTDGAISIVYSQRTEAAAEEIKKDLRAKFPQVARINDIVKPALTAGDVQMRLF